MKNPVQVGASHGIKRTVTTVDVARAVNLPVWAAFALLEKESSGGRNVYGNDPGGVYAGTGKEVTSRNFARFLVLVMNGARSNGVGPCQITYAGALLGGRHRDGGYFRLMLDGGLAPWSPRDNMRFGFNLLREHHAQRGSWREAGTAYNGHDGYGEDFVDRCNVWRDRLGLSTDVQ